MRFLHTADWQLGMTRHFLNGEAQPRFSAARREAVAALGELATTTGAQFVVVAGDVFESNHLAAEVVSQALEALRAIPVPVYLLPGNHDPLDASSVYTSALFVAECPDHVVVLDGTAPVALGPGVELVAAPWRSKAPTTDLLGAVVAALPADGTVRVVVGHGGVDLFEPEREKAALIRLDVVADAVARSAVHYVALGDKHSRTPVGGTGRVWYSGSPEVTNYDHVEPDSGQVLLVDIDTSAPAPAHHAAGAAGAVGAAGSAHPVTVTPHRVGRWRFLTLVRTVDGPRDIVDLGLNLEALADKERTVVQLGLTGTLSVTDMATLEECLARWGRVFAALTLWERETDLVVEPVGGEFDDLEIGGFAASALAELVAAARPGEARADDARAALALLRRLAGRSTRAGAA